MVRPTGVNLGVDGAEGAAVGGPGGWGYAGRSSPCPQPWGIQEGQNPGQDSSPQTGLQGATCHRTKGQIQVADLLRQPPASAKPTTSPGSGC